jgi:hypothetical protein
MLAIDTKHLLFVNRRKMRKRRRKREKKKKYGQGHGQRRLHNNLFLFI